MTSLATALAGHITGEARQAALGRILADPKTMKELAGKTITSQELLDELARKGGKVVRRIIANNTGASAETLNYLIGLKEKEVSEDAKFTLQRQQMLRGDASPAGKDLTPAEALCEYYGNHGDPASEPFARLARTYFDELREKMANTDIDWEEESENILEEISGIDLLPAVATYPLEGSPKQWQELLAKMFIEVVSDLSETSAYEWDDRVKAKLAALRGPIQTLKVQGWAPKNIGLARIASLLDPGATKEELAAMSAGLKKGDYKILAASLAYAHPVADLEIEAAALKAGGQEIPAGLISEGNQYGTKDHALMVIEKVGSGPMTLDLLYDDSIKWPKILGAEYTARTLGKAIETSDGGGEELEHLMTLEVARELVATCKEDLFFILMDQYTMGSKLAVAASYNEDQVGYGATTLWSKVPAGEVMNMSVPSLLAGLGDDWTPEVVEKKLQKALAGLGKAVGDSEKILLTVDGVGKTFKGSIKELGELAKEATTARQKTKETPALPSAAGANKAANVKKVRKAPVKTSGAPAATKKAGITP